jgi:endonuclease V-like protein UPF0215 family
LKAIFLGSSTIAAFNVIDFNLLYEQTSLPTISILSVLPDNKEVKNALSHLPDWEKRLAILSSNPPIKKISFVNQSGRNFNMYVQYIGFDEIKDVERILQISTYSSSIPECLRLADLIGRSFQSFIM